MNLLLKIARGLIGGTFIVSGLVKANDILGFSYKLEEYFDPRALGWTIFTDWSVELSALVCIAEVLLGAFLLMNIQKKYTASLILLMTVFFGWLTLYTATCDPSATKVVMENGVETTVNVMCVNDCGCFGDAMKDSLGRSLTPWESFYKDLALFILVIPIVISSWMKKEEEEDSSLDENFIFAVAFMATAFYAFLFSWPFLIVAVVLLYGVLKLGQISVLEHYTKRTQGVLTLLLTVYFANFTFNHLPLKDFRAFKIGANIKEGMMECEELGKPCPEFGSNFVLLNKETGEEEMVPDSIYTTQEKYWAAPYEFKTSSMYTKKQGYVAPIQDFELTNKMGENQTDYILGLEKVHLVIAYEADHSSDNEMVWNRLSQLTSNWDQKKEAYYFVSANEDKEFEYNVVAKMPFLYADGITLKTIIRSHPGVVTLKKGVVENKTHFNDLNQLLP